MTEKYPVIIVDLPEPVSGYWDGGKKSHFEFSPSPKEHYKGSNIQWGSFSANFWFMAAPGVSWKAAVAAAQTKLKRMLKIKGAKITVEWRS